MVFNYLPWALSLLAREMRVEFSANEFPEPALAPKESVPSLLLQNTLYLAMLFPSMNEIVLWPSR